MSIPAANFDDPFTILVGCHRRIEGFLESMKKSGELLGNGQCDATVKRALLDALHFFKVAAPLHTKDEEESLIPRLNKAMRVSDEMYEHTIKHILDDHQELDELHVKIDHDGRALAEAIGEDGSVDFEAVSDTNRRFRANVGEAADIYSAHMIVEERDIAPLAKAIIPPDELKAIGREMAERRGLDPDATAPDFGDVWKKLSEEEA